MAIINGKVFYSQDSYASYLQSETAIVDDTGNPTIYTIKPSRLVGGITITLWKKDSGTGVRVVTKDDGTYTINDVNAAGVYWVVETFGQQSSNIGVASFNNAVNMEEPAAADPTIEFINEKGFVTNDGTRIISLTPNTVILDFQSGVQEKTVDFGDAPCIIRPLELGNFVTTGDNLIKSVDGGTFGNEPRGTPGGTCASTCPYTKYEEGTAYESDDYNSEFYDNYIAYGTVQPQGGYYTIVNIADKHTWNNKWFDTAGRTQGDETGRFLIVNGDDAGKYFFMETVPVKKETNYLFTAWIMNIYRLPGGALPLFEVIVKDKACTTELFKEEVSLKNPLVITTIPEWKQIGAIIPADAIMEDGEITVIFYSRGEEISGNDYCVDDIIFYELEPCTEEPILKKAIIDDENEVIKSSSIEDKEIKYRITLINDTTQYISNLELKDQIQYGTQLFSDKMTIKAADMEFQIAIDADSLAEGIDISSEIASNVSTDDPNYELLKEGKIPRSLPVVAEYSIKVPDGSVLPNDKIVYNTAVYQYVTPLDTKNMVPRYIISNKVQTEILCPDIESSRTAPKNVKCGEEYKYNIEFPNTGDAPASVKKITDNLPDGFEISKVSIKMGDTDLKEDTDYTYKIENGILIIEPLNDSLDIDNPETLYVEITGKYSCDNL